jgi:O-antigen ligase
MSASSSFRPAKLAARPTGGEQFFTGFALFLSTSAFMNLVGSDESTIDKGIGSTIMQAIWSLIYLATLFLVVGKCKGFLAIIRREKWLLLLVALTMVSVSWSDDPALTFRRSVALIGTTLFGIYFASRFSLVDQLKILSRVFVVAAVLSLLFVAILPHYGMSTAEFAYAWRGIYPHKNVLGVIMALGIVVFAFRAFLAKRNALRWWVAMGLALFLLLMAHSSTALVGCAFGLFALALAHVVRWPLRKAVPIFLGVGVVAIGAAVWAVSNLTYVLSLMNRDSTFTGRTTIWLVSMVMITRHPWLGYGYNEFWPGYGTDIVARFLEGFQTSHAHSAILNLWLDVGFVGVAIFMLQYFRSVWHGVKVARHTTTIEWLWPLVFLLFLGVYGLDESVVLQRNGLSWILFTAAAYQVSSRKLVAIPKSSLATGQAPTIEVEKHD